MMRALVISAAAAAMAACTPAVQTVPGVQEAQARDVAGCAFVGKVIGQPEAFGVLQQIGIQGARKAALEKAAELGGNRVVFDPIPVSDAPVTELPGQVYRC